MSKTIRYKKTKADYVKNKNCASFEQENEYYYEKTNKAFNSLVDIEFTSFDFGNIAFLFEKGEFNVSFYEFIMKDVSDFVYRYIKYLQSINDLSLAMNAIKMENSLCKAKKHFKWAYESYYKRFNAELSVNLLIRACHYCLEIYRQIDKLNNLILNKR